MGRVLASGAPPGRRVGRGGATGRTWCRPGASVLEHHAAPDTRLDAFRVGTRMDACRMGPRNELVNPSP